MNRFRSKFAPHWVGGFYDETYRANVDIIWPVRAVHIAGYVKRRTGITDYKLDDDFGAKTVECCNPEGGEINIICLRTWSLNDPRDVAMLAHEVFHVAEHILSRRNITLTSGQTEPYAYLIESIMRRCLTLLDTKRPIQK